MAKSRRACDLRHTITIQEAVASLTAGGGSAVVWTKVVTVRAAIDPLSGSETLRAMQLQAKISHRITIRYRSGITAAMRILFGARTMNIRAILNPGERNRWLEIMAEEGVAT